MRLTRPWALVAVGLAVWAAASAPDLHAASGSGVSFDDRAPDVLVLQTVVYRLTLSKRTGALVELQDRRSGLRVVAGANGCGWSAVAFVVQVGGCGVVRAGSRFDYRWNRTTSTLTMRYTAGARSSAPVDAAITLRALRSSFDLRLRLLNRSALPVRTVDFPAGLRVPVKLVTAGYAPSFLPGVKLGPAFFRRSGDDLATYPSKGAFADYLALDFDGASFAVYSVNPAPAPLAPVELGFVHGGSRGCAGALFCVRHAFATWIPSGRRWTSPIVRVRVGEPVEHSIVDYRVENRIDRYASAAAKLGPLLPTLARAPLVKMDPAKGLPSFAGWAAALRRLPSPSLLHPAGFQAGGFDVNDPDFLPPDPRLGTQADFGGVIDQAHALGQLVMPYLNAGWWDPGSPTVQELAPGQTLADVSVQNRAARPVTERFGAHEGYVVSPYVPFVRARFARLFEQFTGSDCLFFDQVGSRPWLYDFNPSSPTPLAYDDGWLALFAQHTDRCLMAEDGWDRMAAVFSGFHGGLMLMQREFHYPDAHWGTGAWEAFPLALWLFHDKVLLYQHDLCECTFTTDPEMLAWNLAYGFLLSYTWDEHVHSLDSPWLAIVAAFQQALGPHYAGVALTSYRQLAAGVTETRFGGYSVVANWTNSPYEIDGTPIAPRGFLARTDDGRLTAGEVSDPSGPVYRIVQDGRTTFTAPVPGYAGPKGATAAGARSRPTG